MNLNPTQYSTAYTPLVQYHGFIYSRLLRAVVVSSQCIYMYTYTLYLLGSAAADTPVLCDNCHPIPPSGTEHVPPVPMKVSDVLR